MTQNEYVYAICCRPEVAGDIISGESVKTIEGYAALNFEVASFKLWLPVQFLHARIAHVTIALVVSEILKKVFS